MKPILHILNGDGTAHPFKKTALAGDHIVWREMLCEGPVPVQAGLTALKAIRFPFLTALEGPEEHVVESMFYIPFERLKQLDGYNEIVLWFEFDLFCQINLLFLAAFLQRQSLQASIYAVSPGSHPDVPDFRGMGQLSSEQLEGLYPQRRLLGPEDLDFAAKCWPMWAARDWEALESEAALAPPNWPHFQKATGLFLRCLPDPKTGLGLLEEFVLQSLRNQSLSFAQLFQLFGAEFSTLGYGDLQFLKVLANLKPNHITLSDGRYQLQTP